jgi:membrane dipeptidase
MLIVDAHQDLAWNMLTFGRDYTRSSEETRSIELGGLAPMHNGDSLLGWPDYQKGRVAVIFATLFAAPIRRKEGQWDTETYTDFEEAHRLYSKQMDAYHRLVDEHPDKFRLVQTLQDVEEIIGDWDGSSSDDHPVGLVVLMEGAEGVRQPPELEDWWGRGVRIIGPAWAGTRFCGGTLEPGPLTPEGFALLEAMADFGFTLDLTHMDEQAVLQALETYPGTIVATHSNPQAMLKDADINRFLSDQVLHGLIERDGIVGIPPFNKFLRWEWTPGDGRQSIPLDLVVEHIDYICQLAGDARHVGIGTDFDGGFGLQSVPLGIESIADLQKLVPLLGEKGYSESDIKDILGNNWLSLLKKTLPTGV